MLFTSPTDVLMLRLIIQYKWKYGFREPPSGQVQAPQKHKDHTLHQCIKYYTAQKIQIYSVHILIEKSKTSCNNNSN